MRRKQIMNWKPNYWIFPCRDKITLNCIYIAGSFLFFDRLATHAATNGHQDAQSEIMTDTSRLLAGQMRSTVLLPSQIGSDEKSLWTRTSTVTESGRCQHRWRRWRDVNRFTVTDFERYLQMLIHVVD
jgi:hypothetical protein